MPRSVSQASQSLPSNLIPLNFPRSDGNPESATLPTNTTKIVDNDKQVNYYRLVSNDEGSSQRWRLGIGTAIAKKQELPAGNYTISDWPEHYRFYEHNKGSEDNPRRDLYLIGSKTVNRFRSIPEFMPHAIWLMGPETDSCTCKYCSNSKSQRVISQNLVAAGIRLSVAPSSTTSSPRVPRIREVKPPVPGTSRPIKPRRAHPYAQVRPRKYTAPDSNKSKPMAQERVQDIRAINQCNSKDPDFVPLYNMFRTDEIVWCQLPSPISCGTGNKEDDLAFWPAVITRPYHKSHDMPPGPSSSNPPWQVRQVAWYEVELFGVNHTKHIEASKVIPFIAWKAPANLLDALHALPPEQLHFDDEKNRMFDPMPTEDLPLLLSDAGSPFSVAIEVATEASRYWTLTDEYEYTPPPPEKEKSFPKPPRPQLFSSQPDRAEVAGISKDMTAEHVQEVANNILGIQSGPSAKQSRFQGLWWGSERIWVDDMVRLKPSRCHLAPDGSEHILPPAHLSPLARQRMLQTYPLMRPEEINEASMGAMSRATLLKVHTIMIVERPTKDGGTKKECRLAGILYELADEDHVDPPTANPGPNPDSAAPAVIETPLAPDSFKFRKIQRDGAETVMSLSVVAGRYYPRMSSHPAVNNLLRQILYRPEPETEVLGQSPIDASNCLFALEGLTPGFFNSVDPITFKQSRDEMLDHAKAKAKADLNAKVTSLMDDNEGGTTVDVDMEM